MQSRCRSRSSRRPQQTPARTSKEYRRDRRSYCHTPLSKGGGATDALDAEDRTPDAVLEKSEIVGAARSRRIFGAVFVGRRDDRTAGERRHERGEGEGGRALRVHTSPSSGPEP